MEHTMHEYTHSHLTPFLSHPHPLFTDGGQHTHIDYTSFLKKKNTLLHYADNTCLTGRNTIALKYVNIQKLTIFHALQHFEPPPTHPRGQLCMAGWECGGDFWGIEIFQLPRGNIFCFYHLCWQQCVQPFPLISLPGKVTCTICILWKRFWGTDSDLD